MNKFLTKQEVLNTIIANVNKAYSDPEGDYANLCLLFEACYGYSVDMRLKFDEKSGKFEVWEETNYN